MSSLTEVLDQFRVDWKPAGHRHVRKGWIGVDCPFCHARGKYRLGFELMTGRVNCWVCGIQYGPKVFSILLRLSEKDANQLWFSVQKDRKHLPIPIAERISGGTLKPPKGRGPLLEAHRRYLSEDRGFDPDEIIQLWSIEGIGIAADFAWRIYIPIFDFYGRQISWTTRSISPHSELRYRSAAPEEEIAPLKSVLYGCHLAFSTAIVSEGPLDAWAWGPGGVATLGLGYSPSQLAAAAKYPIRAVCFDSEPGAQKRADKLCRELSAFPGKTEKIVLETGDDPASAEKSEIEEVRRYLGLI